MTTMAVCRGCGAPIIADAVAGQCPACLLALARTPDDDAAEFDLRQFGDYVLGRQIGAGGMGVVYEAHRLSDGHRVAIKLIRDFHLTSATSLRRFTIEAEAAARLDHPNIVRIHEVGESHGHPYFAMDFIEGESLETKIGRGEFGPLRVKDCARLIAIIARAVHHAHARGVVHRDLKPGNVLIDAGGVPHLTDFGLAKILEPPGNGRVTASNDFPGTPSYMSPEQVRGSDVGCASDIYSLGAVLHALLTGRPPFQGPTPLDIFRQIAEQSPLRPRSAPRELAIICLKCLEKDPGHRYSSAATLADDLERFAEGRPIQARPLSPAHRVTQWVRRNPIGTALIVSLCAGLTIALLLLRIVDRQRREIQLDRDIAFDEGMQKISQIWRDPATKSVTITARELGILAGHSPVDARGAKHQLTLAVSADDGPSSMAQRYARLLGTLQEHLERALGEKTVFNLQLLKRFSPEEETLAQGAADFVVLSAVDFLQAQGTAPGVTAIAHAETSREGVIVARTNVVLRELRNRAIAFPDPDLALTVSAKGRLFYAGLRRPDFRFVTNIVDQGPETGQSVISTAETLDLLLRGKVDAAVTHRTQFERYRHLGLVMLDQFPETPRILAGRPGLEREITVALSKAITHAPWPESKFVAGAPLLDDLRAALRHVDAFDQ